MSENNYVYLSGEFVLYGPDKKAPFVKATVIKETDKTFVVRICDGILCHDKRITKDNRRLHLSFSDAAERCRRLILREREQAMKAIARCDEQIAFIDSALNEVNNAV